VILSFLGVSFERDVIDSCDTLPLGRFFRKGQGYILVTLPLLGVFFYGNRGLILVALSLQDISVERDMDKFV
jgi:hypothetical protein